MIKKIVRVIIGCILIALGAMLLAFGFWQLGTKNAQDFFTIIAPMQIAALGIILVGWLILRGTTWRDILDFITSGLWP